MFARVLLVLCCIIGASALRTAPSMIFGWPMGGAKKASTPAPVSKAAPAKMGMTKAAPTKMGVATKAAPAKAAAWQFGTGSQNKVCSSCLLIRQFFFFIKLNLPTLPPSLPLTFCNPHYSSIPRYFSPNFFSLILFFATLSLIFFS